jgi:hypothetical protein
MLEVLGPNILNSDNVFSTDFQIVCLTETWLNDICFDHKLFPDPFTIFHSDRVSSTKSKGGGVPIVILVEFGPVNAGVIYIFMTNASDSKFPPKLAVVYLLVITPQYQTGFYF